LLYAARIQGVPGMGLWSSIKKAVKKAVRIVKAVVRIVVKVVVTVVTFVVGALGSIFFWVRKKMRISVCILHPEGQGELVSVQEAEASIERAAQIFKDRFDVRLIGYGKPRVQVIKPAAPDEALDPQCSATGFFKSEFGVASDFYSSWVAGWVAITISLVFPVTVFVVRRVTHGSEDWRGCSFGLFTDYVVITPDGIRDDTTLAHELGHSGFLLHRDDKGNLMHHSVPRGTSVTGWQKWWFRSSRHVNFW
jgi:hypothetical protein